jgi:N-acetylglucosaminyldiphosphoundecaprenol N-acetyl-beta-D-mannosaminyltransferase
VEATASPEEATERVPRWLHHRAPLREMAIWLLLWPAWWILGIEQFVPSVAFPLLALRLALSGQLELRRYRAVTMAFGLFLLAQLLSAFGIDQARRLLTFGRAFSSWVAAYAVFVLATGVPRSLGDVKRLIWLLAALVAIASLVSVAALLGFRPTDWRPFAELLVPSSLDRGGYLTQLFERSLARAAFFRPLGEYYRVSSLFLWPLQNASAMAAALPLVGTLTREDAGWKRVLAWVIILLGLVNLTFTTGRAAMGGLVAGGLLVWAFYSRYRRLFWRLAIVTLVLIGVAVVVDLVTPGGSFLLDRGFSTLTAVAFARDRWVRGGSAAARFDTVLGTLRGWLERPVLGWGTAREVPELALPAGTHSTYLGILYKHGAVGLAAFACLLALVWRHSRPIQALARDGKLTWSQALLLGGRWSLVAVLVDGLTSMPSVDTMAVTLIWLGLGVVIAGRRLLQGEQTKDGKEDDVAHVLGVRVHSFRSSELTTRVIDLAQRREHALVLNVNAHCLNLAYTRPWLRELLNRAELVFCDGAGVVLAARLLGQRIAERITYAEWMWDLGAAASESGVSMAFVGAAPGVATEAARRLQEVYPDLRVEALHHGYFDKSEGAAESNEVIDAINAMSPDILVVGFGMPIQERWLAANWSRIDAGLALTGGGVFDYVSGVRQRAPSWMTDHALEWLGRLAIEPGRLWRRYLVGNPLFAWRVLKQAVGIDRWPTSDAP